MGHSRWGASEEEESLSRSRVEDWEEFTDDASTKDKKPSDLELLLDVLADGTVGLYHDGDSLVDTQNSHLPVIWGRVPTAAAAARVPAGVLGGPQL